MSKRFFDTELFDKVWFRKLKPKYKSLWFYILCNCDIAGIWEHDFEACEFFIGEKIDRDEAVKIFSSQLLKIDEKRFIVKDFIEFQNGITLNPKSPVHLKIISLLEKYNLYDRVLNRVSYTHIVVVEVIEEVIGKEIVVVKPEKFDFKASLLKYGFDEILVNDWLLIRKNKKATNSETAFKDFIKEVEKADVEINECLKMAVVKSWSGFKAEWYKNELIKNNTNGTAKFTSDSKKASLLELATISSNHLKQFEGGNG